MEAEKVLEQVQIVILPEETKTMTSIVAKAIPYHSFDKFYHRCFAMRTQDHPMWFRRCVYQKHGIRATEEVKAKITKIDESNRGLGKFGGYDRVDETVCRNETASTASHDSEEIYSLSVMHKTKDVPIHCSETERLEKRRLKPSILLSEETFTEIQKAYAVAL